jgi:hypothetical protein
VRLPEGCDVFVFGYGQYITSKQIATTCNGCMRKWNSAEFYLISSINYNATYHNIIMLNIHPLDLELFIICSC